MTPQLTKSCGSLINGPGCDSDPRRGFWTEVIPVVPLTALRKRVILITCAPLLAAVGLNVQMLMDLNAADVAGSRDRPDDQSSQVTVEAQSHNRTEYSMLGSTRTRSAVVLMFTVACLASIGYVFVRKTVSPPLDTMTTTLREIAGGNLSVTAPVLYSDGIGDLGNAINEVAANYQEVLLFAGTVVGNSLPVLETIDKTLESPDPLGSRDELKRQLGEVRGELEKLGSVIKDFEFYEVRFDGRQALPRTQPDDIRCG